MIRRCPGWIDGVHPVFDGPKIPEHMRGKSMPHYLGQTSRSAPDYMERKHEETTAICPDCLAALRKQSHGTVREMRHA